MTNQSNNFVTDIPQDSWISSYAPKIVQPYLRLVRADRPTGTWLLVIPCWWSVALATPTWPDLKLCFLFAIGALAMRGAGCTINDIIDRKFDARVARTSTRPIANGEISVLKALIFLGLQLSLGLIVLLNFNTFAILLGATSLLLIVLYPFMKRLTYWPQLFLGFTFNWGALLGCAAATGTLSTSAVILYVAGIFWTLGYDTIYAHQDKEDDILIGVKSTALKLGDTSTTWLFGFYTSTLFLIGLAGFLIGLGWPFYLSLFTAGLHLMWQIKSVNLSDPKSCLSKFSSNRNFGLIVLFGIIAAQIN